MNSTNTSKVSKSQIEVWEMKEAMYNEVKDMPLYDGLKYILNKSQTTTEKYVKERDLKAN